MKKLLLLFLGLTTLFFTSCSDDDKPSTDVENEEELITELVFTLTEEGGTDVITYTITNDLGLDKGTDGFVITGDLLKANTTYNGSITLTNTIDNEDITAEVKEEDDEHQFFFIEDSEKLTINYTDVDDEGNPLGLTSKVIIGDLELDERVLLQIILKHEPVKDAEGVSEGNIENAAGSTDLDIEFNIG